VNIASMTVLTCGRLRVRQATEGGRQAGDHGTCDGGATNRMKLLVIDQPSPAGRGRAIARVPVSGRLLWVEIRQTTRLGRPRYRVIPGY